MRNPPAMPPVCQLGLALWWTWAYVVFYSQSLLPDGDFGSTAPRDTWISSCFGYVLTMMAIIAVSGRIDSVACRIPLCIASSITTCAGTLVLAVSYHVGYSGPFWLAANVAAFVTGFGTALLSIAWGELFGSLGMDGTGRIVTISLFIGIVLNLCIIALPEAIRIPITVLLPAASMAMLRKSFGTRPDPVPEHDAPSEYDARPLPAKLIVNIGAIAITFGYLRGIGLTGEELRISPYVLFSGIAVVALVLAIYTNVMHRPMNVGHIYRAAMLVLIVSFVSIPYLMDSALVGMAAAAVTACYDCFDMVVWAIMANVAALASTSTVVTFAWGRLSNHVGMLIGVGLGFLVSAWPAGVDTLQNLVSIAIVFILVLCIFVSTREIAFFTTPLAIVRRMSVLDEEFADACTSIACDYGLTPREREVFELLGRGRNAACIAEALIISDNTVKTHARHIYKKLGINSQQQLMDLIELYCSERAP